MLHIKYICLSSGKSDAALLISDGKRKQLEECMENLGQGVLEARVSTRAGSDVQVDSVAHLQMVPCSMSSDVSSHAHTHTHTHAHGAADGCSVRLPQ